MTEFERKMKHLKEIAHDLYHIFLLDTIHVPLNNPNTTIECTKYNSIRDRLRDRAFKEGMTWPLKLNFWVRKRYYDIAAYVSRAMRQSLQEEPLHRQYSPTYS